MKFHNIGFCRLTLRFGIINGAEKLGDLGFRFVRLNQRHEIDQEKENVVKQRKSPEANAMSKHNRAKGADLDHLPQKW